MINRWKWVNMTHKPSIEVCRVGGEGNRWGEISRWIQARGSIRWRQRWVGRRRRSKSRRRCRRRRLLETNWSDGWHTFTQKKTRICISNRERRRAQTYTKTAKVSFKTSFFFLLSFSENEDLIKNSTDKTEQYFLPPPPSTPLNVAMTSKLRGEGEAGGGKYRKHER